jgi:hypothetical protein
MLYWLHTNLVVYVSFVCVPKFNCKLHVVISRHLCVCESCLVFIDKCPVCRAAFEEYIVIQLKEDGADAGANGEAPTGGETGNSNGTF